MWAGESCATVQGRHSVVMVLACREWSRCAGQAHRRVLTSFVVNGNVDQHYRRRARRTCGPAVSCEGSALTQNPSSRSWDSITPDFTDEHDISCAFASPDEEKVAGRDTMGHGGCRLERTTNSTMCKWQVLDAPLRRQNQKRNLFSDCESQTRRITIPQQRQHCSLTCLRLNFLARLKMTRFDFGLLVRACVHLSISSHPKLSHFISSLQDDFLNSIQTRFTVFSVSNSPYNPGVAEIVFCSFGPSKV